MDINVKDLKKNAFRYSKVRGETASRIRITGGKINAKVMRQVAEIAEEYGDGTIFITNRQGIELLGIPMEKMDEVNQKLQPIIDAMGTNQEERGKGYSASGTRNIVACPGEELCPFGCYDTTAFARKVEHEIFPNNRHVKVAFTGCSNDCAKVRMDDFGIIGMTEPQYDPDRCIGCGQCVKYCEKRSVGALRLVNNKVVRDTDLCIGCGVCVTYCPTRAWTRSKERYFRLTVEGVAPTEETVLDGTYKIQRNFNVITKEGAELSPQAQAFFDYMQSKDADELIKKAGAVPVAK